MSKWNAWEDGPSRNPPDGARTYGKSLAAEYDSAHIAALNLQAVLALLTELETLRAREGEMRKALQNARHAIAARWAPSISELLMEIDRALLTPASPGEGK